jgi:hypothetical protein
MTRRPAFDDVLIVNPFDPDLPQQGAHAMRFRPIPAGLAGYAFAPYHHALHGYGPYAAPPELSEAQLYGYQAAELGCGGPYGRYQPVGYFADEPPMAGYPIAGYPVGGYAAPGYPAPGYSMAGYPAPGYAEAPAPSYPMAGYPVAGYAEAPPSGYAGPPPLAAPELYGYGAPEYAGYEGSYGAETSDQVGWPPDPAVSGYEEAPDFAAYVRPQQAGASCPVMSNVAGVDESPAFEGYVRPPAGGPSCDQLTNAKERARRLPATLKPLW